MKGNQNPNPMYRLEMAYKVRSYLIEHQMSMSYFSRKCHISVLTLKRLLTLKPSISVRSVCKIAQYMGCSVGELVEPPDDPNIVNTLHNILNETKNPAAIFDLLSQLSKEQLQRVRLYILWAFELRGDYNDETYQRLYADAIADINK